MAATASRKMRLLNVLGAAVFLFVLMCHLGQNLTGERELRIRGNGRFPGPGSLLDLQCILCLYQTVNFW